MSTFNPADRRLCPDGSCIGLVGADGRCRVCGRAGDGSAAASAPAPDAAHFDDDDNDNTEDSLSAGGADSSSDGEASGSGAFRPDRRLCEDGSCVGVIGAGDVCSVCGRPAGS
jgi:hypothetical protein